MKLAKKLILGVAAACALGATAQEASRTAYFMDGYSYRHELNPAFSGERNYISIPALGNMNISLFSSVGVNNFLFPTKNIPQLANSGYGLTTFMSPYITADQFLGKLSNNNKISTNFDFTLLSTGFKAFHGYNTISIGVHAGVGLNIPKDMLKFLKVWQDGADTHYNFKDVRANATAMAEIALGHSHKITEDLTIGAKLKFLVGLGNVSAHITDMDVRMNENAWTVMANGKFEAAAGTGLVLPTRAESGIAENASQNTLIDWEGIQYNNFGIGGYGLGIDLGATYKLLDGDLELSAAVQDLGFIDWKNGIVGKTQNTEPWSFNGFHNIAINPDEEAGNVGGNNSIDDQLDNMLDDLKQVVNFHREDVKAHYVKSLNATIRVGAEYKMPFYKNLTAGFLFSSYIAGVSSWTEGRFYANVKPTKWFDATINYGASTYGNSFGWMINFHPKGFNFFIGTDHQIFKVTKQFIPVGHLTGSINFGFNVTFGS